MGYEVTLLYPFLFLKELLAIENQTYSTKVKKSKNRPNSLHGVQGELLPTAFLCVDFPWNR